LTHFHNKQEKNKNTKNTKNNKQTKKKKEKNKQKKTNKQTNKKKTNDHHDCKAGHFVSLHIKPCIDGWRPSCFLINAKHKLRDRLSCDKA
jgi:uncharacterized protein YdaU (DUF1376 family)